MLSQSLQSTARLPGWATWALALSWAGIASLWTKAHDLGKTVTEWSESLESVGVLSLLDAHSRGRQHVQDAHIKTRGYICRVSAIAALGTLSGKSWPLLLSHVSDKLSGLFLWYNLIFPCVPIVSILWSICRAAPCLVCLRLVADARCSLRCSHPATAYP